MTLADVPFGCKEGGLIPEEIVVNPYNSILFVFFSSNPKTRYFKGSPVFGKYGASSQKATSMAGVSVSPMVPSKSNRMDMSLYVEAFSIVLLLLVVPWEPRSLWR